MGKERAFMKMFLISDNIDTYTGMRLAGVEGVVVHEREELRRAQIGRASCRKECRSRWSPYH